MLGLNLDQLNAAITSTSALQFEGKLQSARGIVTADIPASVGEVCMLRNPGGEQYLAEVIGFEGSYARLLPYEHCGLTSETRVRTLRRPVWVPFGDGLLGRIVNGLGQPIDEHGALANFERVASNRLRAPDPLKRRRVETPLETGQRAIDGFLTLGIGQRVGLFAGSGVGKSTLLGEIAKHAQSEVNVIVLVGERGREVRPFIEDCLGPKGLARSVMVVATSDETPLMRVRAVETAVTIADRFRNDGRRVLFMADSLTRLAMAQREIGLLLGEPPTARGYTPSVFQLLARMLEQLGNSEHGSITAITTVLVDADDMDDPIADCVRSIVDGHIVMDRRLAERGHFPAINVGASISRVFSDVANGAHQQSAQSVRTLISTYNQNIELVRAGAYEMGASPAVDAALRLMPAVDTILRQAIDEHTNLSETVSAITAIAEQWESLVT